MKQRIITGLVLAAILFPALYVGGWPLRAVVIFFLSISTYEIIHATGKKFPVLILILLLGSVFVIGSVQTIYVLPLVTVLLVGLFIITILTEVFQTDDLAYLFMMTLMMALTFRAVVEIQSFGTRMVVYIAFITYATDTTAYFAGVFLGKHKLKPSISPKKTVEGSIGGWIGGFAIGMLFGFLFIRNIPFHLILISSLVLPVIGQFGDLAFSALKRHYAIKDFGSIFPAHGGVLDRIDSLIFNLLFFYVLIIFFL
jgi:phosphatidate cytidylyltransferase